MSGARSCSAARCSASSAGAAGRARPRGAFEQSGSRATGDAQAATLLGTATYDDIVVRWGPPDEDRERLSTPGRRTMVYRAQKDGKAHEVEIELVDGRVMEIERRVYRLQP